jgi:hypothetical protein
VVPLIALETFPQSIDRARGALDALNKDFLGVQQMPRDAQVQVAFAALHQQIEQMQTTQFVGGF